MWIWFSISMLLVIACIIFGIYSFISSRTLQKSILPESKYKNTGYQGNDLPFLISVNDPGILQKQTLVKLKTKLKAVEESSLLSVRYLEELKKRIEALESAGNLTVETEEAKWNNEGEDWEKLYYDIKREKQSLEDNLNQVKDILQENISKVQDLEKQRTGWAAIKSEVESKINEIHSLQNIIEELQRNVDGGRERERELAKELAYEKSKHLGQELMQTENNRLRSEVDMLTNSLAEMNRRNVLMEEKIKGLTELGSILEISEYEKMGIKNSFKQLLQRM